MLIALIGGKQREMNSIKKFKKSPRNCLANHQAFPTNILPQNFTVPSSAGYSKNKKSPSNRAFLFLAPLTPLGR